MAKKVQSTVRATGKISQKKSPPRQKPTDPGEKFRQDYLKQLRAEHRGGAPTAEEIERQISDAEDAVTRLKTEIDAAKALSTKRKQEIDEWKLWYNGLAKIDKSAEWAKLEAEIAWRAAEINDLHLSVGTLYEQHLAAKTRLEMAHQRQAAFASGALAKPLAEDPRYVQLMRPQALPAKK